MLDKLYELGYDVCTQMDDDGIKVTATKGCKSVKIIWINDVFMINQHGFGLTTEEHTHFKLSRTRWIHNDINYVYETIYRTIKGEE